jgi:hypothetical protein
VVAPKIATTASSTTVLPPNPSYLVSKPINQEAANFMVRSKVFVITRSLDDEIDLQKEVN